MLLICQLPFSKNSAFLCFRFKCSIQMLGLVNMRFAIHISAAACQQHTLVVKFNAVD